MAKLGSNSLSSEYIFSTGDMSVNEYMIEANYYYLTGKRIKCKRISRDQHESHSIATHSGKYLAST